MLGLGWHKSRIWSWIHALHTMTVTPKENGALIVECEDSCMKLSAEFFENYCLDLFFTLPKHRLKADFLAPLFCGWLHFRQVCFTENAWMGTIVHLFEANTLNVVGAWPNWLSSRRLQIVATTGPELHFSGHNLVYIGPSTLPKGWFQGICAVHTRKYIARREVSPKE